MFSDLRRIYRESLKPADSLFNNYLARPIAALVVLVFARTRVTPNQITFVSLAVMLLAVAALVGLSGPLGLWLGIALIELSYIFDCADGQLARVTGRSSPVGASLDFLMDELKALLLVGAIAVRWAHFDGGGRMALLVGIGTLVVVGSALSLTKFVRSAEYAEATNTKQQGHGESAGSRSGVLWPLMSAIRLISQYPQTLPLFALFDALHIFLYAYAAVHLLYVARTALVLLIRLGRFAPETRS